MRRLIPLLAALALAGCSQQPAAAPPAKPSPEPSAAATPAPTATPTPGPPQREEPALPQPMEETAAASAGGRLYVIGGFTPSGASSAAVFYFDGSWHPGPQLPLGLDHTSAAALDGVLYLAGGYSAGRASARLLRLDGDHWTDLAPLHHARGALALVALGGRLYALGGAVSAGGPEIGPAEVYDPKAGGWQDLPPLAKARDHVAGFAWQGLACVAGGRTPNTPVVDCFDVAQQRWTAFAQLPFPTSGAGAGALEDRVLVAGGEDAQESAVVSQVAVFAMGSWTAEPMLVPRHGFQLAEYGGRLWACGGGSEAGLHPVATCTSLR